MNAFYYGCYRESGHYLWTKNFSRISGDHDSRMPTNFPCKVNTLDGGLMPPRSPDNRYSADGEAFFAHVNLWTIISFNDSSVDTRPGSHSVFILEGIHDFERAIALARDAFPIIFQRFKFEVKKSKRLEEWNPTPQRKMTGDFGHVCFSSIGLDELSAKQAKDDRLVLSILAEAKQFSTFDATANMNIANTMDRLGKAGYFKSVGGSWPWLQIEITEAGQKFLEGQPDMVE